MLTSLTANTAAMYKGHDRGGHGLAATYSQLVKEPNEDADVVKMHSQGVMGTSLLAGLFSPKY